MPQPIREGINLKLDDGWPYEGIRAWLFAQKADRDIPALNLNSGDSYSLVWTRTTPTEEQIIRNFGVALSGWYHTHFPEWRREQADCGAPVRALDRIDHLTASVSDKDRPAVLSAGTDIIRSLLLDVIRNNHSDPDKLVRLVHAWIRINQTDDSHYTSDWYQTR